MIPEQSGRDGRGFGSASVPTCYADPLKYMWIQIRTLGLFFLSSLVLNFRVLRTVKVKKNLGSWSECWSGNRSRDYKNADLMGIRIRNSGHAARIFFFLMDLNLDQPWKILYTSKRQISEPLEHSSWMKTIFVRTKTCLTHTKEGNKVSVGRCPVHEVQQIPVVLVGTGR